MAVQSKSESEPIGHGHGDSEGESEKGKSVEEVVLDGTLVEQILQHLASGVDRQSAASVCKVWNEAVAWSARKLVVRCRFSLAELSPRFPHIMDLDLSKCTNQLEDQDLRVAAAAFLRLKKLRIGHVDYWQRKVTEAGVAAFAESCLDLEQVQLSSLPFCYAGPSVLVQKCVKLRVLHLENCRSLEVVKAIAGCRELQELSLKGEFMFPPSGLAIDGKECVGLMKLVLELGAVNIDQALNSVAHECHRLRDVSLKFKTATLLELSRCTTLCSLAFESDREYMLDDAVIAIASTNKNLTEFISPNRLSNNAVIKLLMKCPQLRKLHLDASDLTESVLSCIQQCKFLSNLSLNNLQSTGQGLGGIGLRGSDSNKFSLPHARGIRDMELQLLMDGNKHIVHLDLQGCAGPTAIGYSSIAFCFNLQYLDLSYTTVDDLSLITIARGAMNIKQLSIVKCEAITNMEAVARFISLESLTLDHCAFVTDEGLGVLSRNCTRLMHLSLAFTRVTDIGLKNMSKCEMLRSLRISFCNGVQGSGVVAIAKACGWFHHVVMSHRLRGSPTANALRQLRCTTHFETDETALVPFDASLNFI